MIDIRTVSNDGRRWIRTIRSDDNADDVPVAPSHLVLRRARGRLARERPNILVVEDEFIIANDIALALREVGAAVLGPVASAEATLPIIAGSRVDAAVLDVKLRDRPIFPLAHELQARSIPFVFATAVPVDRLPPEFASVRRWEKPFDVGAMANELLILSRRRRSSRQERA